jgi:hypothetical protein
MAASPVVSALETGRLEESLSVLRSQILMTGIGGCYSSSLSARSGKHKFLSLLMLPATWIISSA